MVPVQASLAGRAASLLQQGASRAVKAARLKDCCSQGCILSCVAEGCSNNLVQVSGRQVWHSRKQS